MMTPESPGAILTKLGTEMGISISEITGHSLKDANNCTFYYQMCESCSDCYDQVSREQTFPWGKAWPWSVSLNHPDSVPGIETQGEGLGVRHLVWTSSDRQVSLRDTVFRDVTLILSRFNKNGGLEAVHPSNRSLEYPWGRVISLT